MKLQLVKTKANNLNFRTGDGVAKKDNFSFGVSSGFSESKKNIFGIIFNLNLLEPNGQFILDLEYEAVFETDQDLDENFKTSDFVAINAPAIAFPYLRAFVSTLTLQAGYDPVLLPSINFVQLADKKPSEEK